MDQNHQCAEGLGVGSHERARRSLRFTRLPGATRGSTLESDVRAGFLGDRKWLPPKYFYDADGSSLFEKICETPEYYPTRTESALLAQHARAILEDLRPGALVELGSGSSLKTEHFFKACEDLDLGVHYQPLDICREALVRAGGRLIARYPWLRIEALIGDYAADLPWLPGTVGPRLFLFLGGTLGNLTKEEAVCFLRTLRAAMHPGDGFLLGFDRVKDVRVLNAAYNDERGYTAEFNLNLLKVLNERLGADFAQEAFVHWAGFNEEESQIEMHLVAQYEQTVAMRGVGLTLHFAEGESILTEISRKFTPEGMRLLLESAGFRWERHMPAENGYFSLALVSSS